MNSIGVWCEETQHMQHPLENVVTSASSMSGMHWPMQFMNPPATFLPSALPAYFTADSLTLWDASDNWEAPFCA